MFCTDTMASQQQSKKQKNQAPSQVSSMSAIDYQQPLSPKQQEQQQPQPRARMQRSTTVLPASLRASPTHTKPHLSPTTPVQLTPRATMARSSSQFGSSPARLNPLVRSSTMVAVHQWKQKRQRSVVMQEVSEELSPICSLVLKFIQSCSNTAATATTTVTLPHSVSVSLVEKAIEDRRSRAQMRSLGLLVFLKALKNRYNG